MKEERSTELTLADVEERQNARRVLRDAYRRDVEVLAQRFTQKLIAGHSEYTLPKLGSILFKMIKSHPRILEPSLALETLAYSDVPDAITAWFPEERFTLAPSGWTEVKVGQHEEETLRDITSFTLPPWQDLAFYAFFNDVSERIYAILGDDPQSYLATRLGIKWD